MTHISEVIEKLKPGKIGNDNTWVGKNYSKADLINDLKSIAQSEKGHVMDLYFRREYRDGDQCYGLKACRVYWWSARWFDYDGCTVGGELYQATMLEF